MRAMSRTLAEEAFGLLHEVCGELGVDARGAQLMRLRSNAVFKIRGDMVVRIATAPDALTRLPVVLAVARWLADRGFPTVRPVDDIPGQPIVYGGRAVTFWRYVQSRGRPTTRQLG